MGVVSIEPVRPLRSVTVKKTLQQKNKKIASHCNILSHKRIHMGVVCMQPVRPLRSVTER